MLLEKGSVISSSIKQKINTKSSTEPELVGVDDGMHIVLLTRNFLLSQGVKLSNNVAYQDNQSAIILEKNGKSSSGRRSRHIDIRYVFVADIGYESPSSHPSFSFISISKSKASTCQAWQIENSYLSPLRFMCKSQWKRCLILHFRFTDIKHRIKPARFLSK
jgi:hypothetical protein